MIDANKKFINSSTCKIVLFSASNDDPNQYVSWMNSILCAQHMVSCCFIFSRKSQLIAGFPLSPPLVKDSLARPHL